jgi:ribose 5-phosphate isomerase B
MAPPKRALFSLNLDTDADHVYQRVEDHNQTGDSHIKVLETKGPTRGHTDLSFVTKPFEKTVNRAVEGVLDGKKIVSKEGEISYSTSTSGSTRRTTGRGARSNEEEDEEKSTLNVVSKSKRRALEKKYDTSEL